jgi:hypothetical protein
MDSKPAPSGTGIIPLASFLLISVSGKHMGVGIFQQVSRERKEKKGLTD